MSKKEKRDFEEIFLAVDAGKNPSRALLQMYRGNYGKLLLSNVFFFIKNSPVWVLPLITANIINAAAAKSAESVHIILVNFIVALAVLTQNIPVHAIYARMLSRAMRDVESRLRYSLVRKLQRLTISVHKNLRSGRIQSKILRDVEAVRDLSNSILMGLVPAIFNAAVSVVITIYKSPVVALFFIVTIPISVGLVSFFRSSIRRTNRAFRQEIENMSSQVSEMVEMIPITRAHGLGGVEVRRMKARLDEVAQKGLKSDMVQAYFGSCSWVVFHLSQVACLAFTGYLAYIEKISVGEIALYQSFFSMILGSVTNIIGMYPQIARGFESIVSVAEILSIRDMENNCGKKKLHDLRGEFSFENVSFSYPDEPEAHVLKNFSLKVRQGECIAFVGESGAGKSTILNLLIGFNFPVSGTLKLDGEDIRDINLTSYRKHIAVVPQNNILFSGSVRDNITYGLPSISEEQLEQVIELANLRDVIDSLPDGLDTKIGEHGGRLSGGQRQRIAIARAMIRNPKVIILDEATSALDNISEYKVQSAMEKLIKGRTTFIVAHRLSTIRNADRIVVLKEGECVEVGTYEELMERRGEFYKQNAFQLR